MSGLQPGERMPNFKRYDASLTSYIFYELHVGQPVVLIVLPSDPGTLSGGQVEWLRQEGQGNASPLRLGLINAPPSECRKYLERFPVPFTVLADDGAIVQFLTGGRGKGLQVFLLDRNLRLIMRLDDPDRAALDEEFEAAYAAGRDVVGHVIRDPAPVLILPRVMDEDLCRELVRMFESDGGQESGVLYLEGGEQRWAPDPGTKIRRDFYLEDDTIQKRLAEVVGRCVLPEIERCFNFRVTRHEPFKMVRYGGEQSGYFRPHRDNVTPDAAHRRFAMTINLNEPDSYEGGQLRFPEYGPHLYQPPQGGAIVFSCSLVHEAVDVTRGYRYALLGFFFNEQSVARKSA